MTIISSRSAQAIACLLTLLFLPLADARAGVAVIDDCAAVGRKVKSAVEKDPTSVLVIVEDSLTAHPDCACEVVKGAIIGSEADSELVEAIVITAVTTNESKAAEIAECAVAAAPDSAKAVRTGLESALGTIVEVNEKGVPLIGAPVDGDPLDSSSGSEPDSSTGVSPLVGTGIFLHTPVGASSAFSAIQVVPGSVSPPNPVP